MKSRVGGMIVSVAVVIESLLPGGHMARRRRHG
jgi:hypothetical protein